jgi:hypothetical protein
MLHNEAVVQLKVQASMGRGRMEGGAYHQKQHHRHREGQQNDGHADQTQQVVAGDPVQQLGEI